MSIENLDDIARIEALANDIETVWPRGYPKVETFPVEQDGQFDGIWPRVAVVVDSVLRLPNIHPGQLRVNFAVGDRWASARYFTAASTGVRMDRRLARYSEPNVDPVEWVLQLCADDNRAFIQMTRDNYEAAGLSPRDYPQWVHNAHVDIEVRAMFIDDALEAHRAARPSSKQ